MCVLACVRACVRPLSILLIDTLLYIFYFIHVLIHSLDCIQAILVSVDTSRAGEGELFVDIFGEEGAYQFYVTCNISVERDGVYLVTFVPPTSDAIYADISFNSQKLPRK